MNEQTSSILDKIISSKQTSAIEAFRPVDVVTQLLKELSTKDEDILRRRFGLNGQKPETLEEIGKQYVVTRERIRQIEHSGIKKIKAAKSFDASVTPVVEVISSILDQGGGVMEEQALLSQLLLHTGDTYINRQSIEFLLRELLTNKFEYVAETANRKAAWNIALNSLDLVDETISVLEDVIKQNQKPLAGDAMLDRMHRTDFYTQHHDKLTDSVVLGYAELSKKIAKNPYGEFGLAEWGSIVPKRMNDKIYLVMKKNGKPMHFNDITHEINAAGFDSRKAYAPTVHNELILNDQYVLIGRGIYALKEWGYKPGVVADVLVRLLTDAGAPMTRDELVSAVMKERVVKRNTILLALTNKKRFTHLPDGRYTIATPALPQTTTPN